ncbi:hypothetical protein IT084_16645 [Desulfallas sp. Bu1-1]|uniref:hypothetical protein n=1 Tax=Desulfallas sp. Bu1-1 TaxID=2787620 RepID=UPI00189E5347|nr:hypothetical protein [Desulfallas sp. Bu1-1]MBF7084568.1 hypothetical protein [Desulfallas sp. Bu1-1]
MNGDFVDQFSKHKQAFLDELKSGNIKVNFKVDGNADSKKMVLELFEKWLIEKSTGEQASQQVQDDNQNFDEFLDEVLARAKKILKERGIHIAYTSLSQKMGITESWKCIRVFGRSNIYYRIGKTRPRKGPNKGREYLVMDLVMDGNKKQVFIPLLKKKDTIENQLGVPLERELPKVEATGKYRLKLLLPYDVVRERNIRLAAKKLADFVGATKPLLTELGVV